MNRYLFDNPQNLWGKWVKAHWAKQFMVLGALSLLLLYFPAMEYGQLQGHLTDVEQDSQQQQLELAHQQQILLRLKAHSQAQQLTPQLAAQLSPINQQIQQWATDVQLISSQWEFTTLPILHLQLQGYFTKTQDLVTALFQQIPQFSLLSLHMSKSETADDDVIHTEISLQFTKE